MLWSAIFTSVPFAWPMMLEMLFSEDSAVVTRPFALPSCWFTLVSAPTSDRTFCATANAPPSSVASATRYPVEIAFCVDASALLFAFSDCRAT